MQNTIKINTTEKFDTNLIAIASKITTGDMKLLPKGEVVKSLNENIGNIEWNEVLHENYPKLKMFVDVEKEIMDYDMQKHAKELKEKLVGKINEIAQKLVCKVHISDRHRMNPKNLKQYKISYHGIYEAYFKSGEHMLKWLIDNKFAAEKIKQNETVKTVKKQLPTNTIDELDWIDQSNYTPHHKFTMIHTVKDINHGDVCPWKIFSKGSTTEDFLITDTSKNFPLIQVDLDTKSPKAKKINKKTIYRNLDLISKSKMKVYEKYFPNFDIVSFNGSLFVLTPKTQKIYCQCCKKTHMNHSNFYGLLKRNGKIYLGCHSSKEKIEVGKIQMCDYLTKIGYSTDIIDTEDISKYYKKITDDMETLPQKNNDEFKLRIDGPKIKSLSESQTRVNSLKDYKCILMHSNTGTGKTKYIYNETEKYDKVLVISSRVSLCKEYKGNLPNYFDYNDIIGDISADRCIICLNSLDRIVDDKIYDCIILDEINSMIKHLVSPTIGSIAIIYSRIAFLMQNAKKVIACDADISDMTICFLNSIFNRHEIKYIKNIHIRPRKQICKYFVGSNKGFNYAECEFFKELRESYMNGDKLYIGCDRKRDVEKIRHYLHDLDDKCDIRCYTSDEGDLNDIIEKNIAEVVIVSPRISYGISLTNPKYFDKVFGYYKNNSITTEEQLQQITRVRNDIPNIIYTEKKKTIPKFFNFKEAKEYYSEAVKLIPKIAGEFGIVVGNNSYFTNIENSTNKNFAIGHKIIRPTISMVNKSLFNDLKIYSLLYNEKSAQNPSKLLMENLIMKKGFNIEIHKNKDYIQKIKSMPKIEKDAAKEERARIFIQNNLDKTIHTKMTKQNIKFWMDMEDDKKIDNEDEKMKQLEFIKEMPDENYKSVLQIETNKIKNYGDVKIEEKDKEKEIIKCHEEYMKNITSKNNLKKKGVISVEEEKITTENEYKETIKNLIKNNSTIADIFKLKSKKINQDEFLYLSKIIKNRDDIYHYARYLSEYKDGKLFKVEFDNEMSFFQSSNLFYITYLKLCEIIGMKPFDLDNSITNQDEKRKNFKGIEQTILRNIFSYKGKNNYDEYIKLESKIKNKILSNLLLSETKETSKYDKEKQKKISIRKKIFNDENLKMFKKLFN